MKLGGGRRERSEIHLFNLKFPLVLLFLVLFWPQAHKKRELKLPRHFQQYQIPLPMRKIRTAPLPLPERKGDTCTNTGMKISWHFILICWIQKHNYYNSLLPAQLLVLLPCSSLLNPITSVLVFRFQQPNKTHLQGSCVLMGNGTLSCSHDLLLHPPIITPNHSSSFQYPTDIPQ